MQVLTGQLPFEGDDISVPREAPESVFSANRAQWENYECTLQAQQTWVSKKHGFALPCNTHS